MDNGGFEEAGAAAGSAAGWFVRSKTSLHLLAGFRETDGDTGIASPNDLTHASWTASQVALLATSTAPDGTSTATRITDNLVNTNHYVALTAARSFEAGKTYTLSAFLKAGTRSVAGLALSTGVGVGVVTLILSTGDIEFLSAPLSGAVSAWSAEVVTLPNGWHKLSLSWTAEVDFTGTPRVTHVNGATVGSTSYAGSFAYFYAWGVSLYEGALSPSESFDWDDEGGYTLVSPVGALWFDGTEVPASAERFSGAWPYTSTGYALSVSGTAAMFSTLEAPAVGDEIPVESFELGWGTSNWTTDASTFINAIFDSSIAPQESENFAEGWGNNEDWTATYSGFACDFDATPGTPSQGFENILRDIEVAPSSGADTLTASDHGLSNGDTVYWRTVGGDRPAGLLHTLRYYVVNATASTFQLSLTNGGAAVNFTSDGTGTHYVRGDGARFWNELDYNASLD